MSYFTTQLITYTLHLADSVLILGHRNSEWTGHGPILEQDIAVSNIALDLIGQARNLYQYAAKLINETPSYPLPFEKQSGEVTEDHLAFLRNASHFKNCQLAEQPNGDWAQTILRQFFFSAYQYYLFQEMQKGTDTQLSAIAEKSLKEITYHLRWSSEWVIRLGDGTTESRERMLKAVDALYLFTAELFITSAYEKAMVQAGVAADNFLIRESWQHRVLTVFEAATLPVPPETVGTTLGKESIHSVHLEPLLAEMQYLQRSYPDAQW